MWKIVLGVLAILACLSTAVLILFGFNERSPGADRSNPTRVQLEKAERQTNGTSRSSDSHERGHVQGDLDSLQLVEDARRDDRISRDIRDRLARYSTHPKERAGLLIRLGLAYGGVGDRQRAEDCYQRALLIAPRDSERWSEANFTLGVHRINGSDRRGALPYLVDAASAERAANHVRKSSLYHVGVLYEELGDLNRASDAYMEFLKLPRGTGIFALDPRVQQVEKKLAKMNSNLGLNLPRR